MKEGEIVEIGDQLTPKAFKDFKVSQVLTFNFEGSPVFLRITKINKGKKKMWAKVTRLYKQEDVDIVDKKK